MRGKPKDGYLDFKTKARALAYHKMCKTRGWRAKPSRLNGKIIIWSKFK